MAEASRALDVPRDRDTALLDKGSDTKRNSAASRGQAKFRKIRNDLEAGTSSAVVSRNIL
jgi:hypothetical protein